MRTPKKDQIPDSVQDRILESALKLFSQKGYAASIREISEASATTLPSIYYHFKNKEGLYQKLMLNRLSELESLTEIDDHFPGSVGEKLKIFVVTTYRKLIGSDDDMAFFRLLTVVSYGPPNSTPPFDIEPYYRKLREYITNIIASGIESGEFRSWNPEHMSTIVLGTVQQVISDILCFGTSKEKSQKTLEDVIDLILSGFRGE